MTKQFDSQSIDAYQARFTGKFDLEYSEGDGMDYGDQVMFVVYGNVSKSGISTDRKTGDMIRTNTVAITDAVPFEKGDLVTLKSSTSTIAIVRTTQRYQTQF